MHRKWHGSHGTDVNDAILAATVARSGGRIWTLNTRRYSMPGLALDKAW